MGSSSFITASSSAPNSCPSKVGVGEDVMMLQYNVCCVCLKRLLSDCPVVDSKQQSVLLKNGERGKSSQKQSVQCVEHERILSGCGQPCKVSPKRDDVCVQRVRKSLRAPGESVFFRSRRLASCVYLRTRHCPVENRHRIDDVSRGQMKGVCVGIRDTKTI